MSTCRWVRAHGLRWQRDGCHPPIAFQALGSVYEGKIGLDGIAAPTDVKLAGVEAGLGLSSDRRNSKSGAPNLCQNTPSFK